MVERALHRNIPRGLRRNGRRSRRLASRPLAARVDGEDGSSGEGEEMEDGIRRANDPRVCAGAQSRAYTLTGWAGEASLAWLRRPPEQRAVLVV